MDDIATLHAGLGELIGNLQQHEKEQFIRQESSSGDLTDLLRKGVLPYEYLASFEKFNSTKLPDNFIREEEKRRRDAPNHFFFSSL